MYTFKSGIISFSDGNQSAGNFEHESKRKVQSGIGWVRRGQWIDQRFWKRKKKLEPNKYTSKRQVLWWARESNDCKRQRTLQRNEMRWNGSECSVSCCLDVLNWWKIHQLKTRIAGLTDKWWSNEIVPRAKGKVHRNWRKHIKKCINTQIGMHKLKDRAGQLIVSTESKQRISFGHELSFTLLPFEWLIGCKTNTCLEDRFEAHRINWQRNKTGTNRPEPNEISEREGMHASPYVNFIIFNVLNV